MKCSITWWYWFAGITIFCIDRITKNAALALYAERVNSGITYLYYEMTINRGISWGLLNFADDVMFIAISLVIALITGMVCLLAYAQYKHHDESSIGYVCVIAGSLSNLFDRFYYHGVIDFIVISVGDYTWPVFNVADVAIVVGVAIIVWQQWFKR